MGIMNIDLRLTTLDRLDEVLALPVTTISVGHEGCPHKLPTIDAIQRAADRIRAYGKHVTFVAPISYERFMPIVIDQIRALFSDGAPLTVVVNDIGMLVVLAERGWTTRCAIAVGHGLSYSFGQQPWFDLALEHEDSNTQEAWHSNSLDDPHIWPQLRKWGVTIIEVDDLPRTRASYEALQTAGFSLNMLLDVVSVAYARSCHTARYYRAAPPQCVNLCDQPFELNMTHRWRLYHNNLEPMSRKSRAHVPDMTVYGNMVYRHVVAEADQAPLTASTVTLDVRFYSPDALQTRIAQLVA